MTKKEKANELVYRFYDYINFSECYQGSKASAKQSALICVDEILKDLNSNSEEWIKEFNGQIGINYWQGVAKEINKL